MNTPPAGSLVSVVIPCYNCADFLDEAIKSVVAQTYPRIEILVVNDGSSDASAGIIRQWQNVIATQGNERSLICLEHEQNRGLPAARNTGIKNASGDLIAFLDADDVWLPEKLTIQVARLRELDVDALFSNWFVWDGTKKELAYSLDRHILFAGNDGLREFIRNNFGNSSTVLVEGSAFETAGLFDETLSSSEDYDLWFRFLLRGLKLGLMPEALAYYRQHPAQMSVKLYNMRASRLTIFKRVVRARPSLLVTCPVLTKKLLTHQFYVMGYKTLARRN